MFPTHSWTRRDFVKSAGAAGLALCLGRAGAQMDGRSNSTIFKVANCPVHDNELRHRGVDTLFRLLADNGLPLYQTGKAHPWGGPSGLIASDDVVLLKVNCQWKCRGTTNTDVVRGLIHRILQHPDGFDGEVVIFENGQGQGAFDGDPNAWGSYSPWPDIDDGIYINAEDETTLTVDHLVQTVFAGLPVSSYLLDPIRANFISGADHATDGYRTNADISYPCFTTSGGRRVELREGVWTGSEHKSNLKLINIPVFKHHAGTGITGALKHMYGVLSMSDGYSGIRHYSQSGTQCGKMWILARPPVLNIVDCIWVSHNSLCGYPVNTTHRANTLLAGIDPVALDYHASKHILLPLGGSYTSQHDPDSYSGLINHLSGAQSYINANGGIGGAMTNQGDANIDLIERDAAAQPSPDIKANGADHELAVASGTPVAVTISLIAAGLAGQPADQWVIARTPQGWWSYTQGGWKHGINRLSKVNITDLASLEVLNRPLPAGNYTFYWVVDHNRDGSVDATWWDSVKVRVM